MLSVAPITPVGVSRTVLPLSPSPVFLGLPLFFQQLAAPQNGPLGLSNLVEERIVPLRY